MLGHTLSHKPKQARNVEASPYCKARDADTVNIPPSWNLNEKQKNFIESMFDEKVK